MNRPDPTTGIWTVTSEQPDSDARRLLGQALPRLMRRPVSDALIDQYFSIFRRRFDEGDCFETAMRAAYLAALCSPDFLYHLDTDPESAWREESADDAVALDDWGLANRLSYLLWNSVPDERLARLAASGQLRDPAVLHGEVERMLVDARSERFLEDFVGQWLKLRQIAATDPDRKLYPEFSPYLQDAMVAETRAYVRRLLDENREIGELVDADWVMVNDVLARHYGLESVTGTSLRPLGTDADCPRGGLQTQGAILKVTANGTTTSPVPRGAFVWERLLGHAPLPPPSSVPAIEPDVRGATTIREQLARHRADPTCSACHRGMDAPGFGLEAFDVIGGYRDRYRSIGEGDPAERGAIDPFIGIGFRLGPTVDATGEWMDGRPFSGPRDLARLLSEQREALTRNLVRQLLVYATGRPMGLAERAEVDRIVDSTLAAGGGVRDLLHGVIGSTLFHESGETLDVPDGFRFAPIADEPRAASLLMRTTLPDQPRLQAERTETAASDRWIAEAEPVESVEWREIEVTLFGFFSPERERELHAAARRIPGAELLGVEFETATARFRLARDVEPWKGRDDEQLVAQLNERLRHASGHTLGVEPLSLGRDEWRQETLQISALDCAACSLAVYEMLRRVPGVEQVTVDLHEGRAVAWLHGSEVDRRALIEMLRSRGVGVAEAETE